MTSTTNQHALSTFETLMKLGCIAEGKADTAKCILNMGFAVSGSGAGAGAGAGSDTAKGKGKKRNSSNGIAALVKKHTTGTAAGQQCIVILPSREDPNVGDIERSIIANGKTLSDPNKIVLGLMTNKDGNTNPRFEFPIGSHDFVKLTNEWKKFLDACDQKKLARTWNSWACGAVLIRASTCEPGEGSTLASEGSTLASEAASMDSVKHTAHKRRPVSTRRGKRGAKPTPTAEAKAEAKADEDDEDVESSDASESDAVTDGSDDDE